jgi:hypothetical protein
MPRAAPFDETERAIGDRLFQLRKELLIPRTACALKLGISTDRLISYEFGRAKLPWIVGERFCLLFGANALWLLTGDGPRWSEAGIQFEGKAVDERTPFSEVMGWMLEDAVDVDLLKKSIARFASDTPPKRDSQNDSIKAAVRKHMAGLVSLGAEIPDEKLPEFFTALNKAVRTIARRFKK